MMEAKFRTDKLQNGNCDTADNFVSPNTADFKTQTSHTVRFKNTATPQAEILFTATPHEKMPNTVTPQIPYVPLPNASQQKQDSFGFALGICFCREVFGFCSEVFDFAVRFLVLP